MMQLMTMDEVSKMISFSKPTIYRWLERKQIPAVKIHGQWRFEKEVVEKWICSLRR